MEDLLLQVEEVLLEKKWIFCSSFYASPVIPGWSLFCSLWFPSHAFLSCGSSSSGEAKLSHRVCKQSCKYLRGSCWTWTGPLTLGLHASSSCAPSWCPPFPPPSHKHNTASTCLHQPSLRSAHNWQFLDNNCFFRFEILTFTFPFQFCPKTINQSITASSALGRISSPKQLSQESHNIWCSCVLPATKLWFAMWVLDLIERSLKRGFPLSAYLSVANYSRAVWRW